MKVFEIIIYLLIISVNAFAQQPEFIKSDSTNLPEEIFIKTKFVEIKSVHEIPVKIISKMKKCVKENNRKFMANPGEFFNSTDNIIGKFPCRRLIFAGKSSQYYFIYYESGGIGLRLVLLMFDYLEPIPKLLLALTSFEKYKSIGELQTEMKNELPLMNINDWRYKTNIYSENKKLIKWDVYNFLNF
ncbi:MAG: hypothetical protein P4L45_01045 [Ignavibacteriaceae bacterium]|nr:hypothetical protein [Ignavibacteriaceae bacterium]